MYKRDIYLDIDDELNNYIKSVELDSDSRVWHFHLTVDYEPLDLTGKSVHFRAEKPDKTNVLNDCKIVDAEKGVVEVKLTRQVNAIPGHVKCLLKIIGDEGFVLKTKTFVVDVSETLSDDAVVSSDEFGALEVALGKVQDIDNRFAQTNAQLSNIESKKLDRNGIITMANLAQDVKEAMTGTSVAVVGEDMILRDNVVENQITPTRTSFISVTSNNILNPKELIYYKVISGQNGYISNENSVSTHFIKVSVGDTLYFSNKNGTDPVRNYIIMQKFDTQRSYTGTLYASLINNKRVVNIDFDGYFVMSININDIHNVCLSLTESDFDEYSSTLDENIKIKHYDLTNKVDNVALVDSSISVEKTDFIKKSKNLLDKNKCVNGFISSSLGIINADDNLRTSDYIKVYSGQTIICSPTIRKFLFFDVNKNADVGSYIDADVANYCYTPTKDGYIRVTYRLTQFEYAQIERGDTATSYEEYGLEFLEPIKNPMPTTIENPLSGKLMWIFGDSIARGNGNNNKGFGEFVADENNMEIVNFAVGGATLGETASNNITTQVDNAISNNTNIPDYILIDGGTNDITVSDMSRGTITGSFVESSFDKSTTTGGFEYCLSKLKNKYPSSKIIFVSVHKMNSRGYDDQVNCQKALKDVCKKWSVPVADIGECGTLNTFLTPMHKYTISTDAQPSGDRTHPNDEGYRRFYSPVIKSILMNI